MLPPGSVEPAELKVTGSATLPAGAVVDEGGLVAHERADQQADAAPSRHVGGRFGQRRVGKQEALRVKHGTVGADAHAEQVATRVELVQRQGRKTVALVLENHDKLATIPGHARPVLVAAPGRQVHQG
jgi:hypothetical protein